MFGIHPANCTSAVFVFKDLLLWQQFQMNFNTALKKNPDSCQIINIRWITWLFMYEHVRMGPTSCIGFDTKLNTDWAMSHIFPGWIKVKWSNKKCTSIFGQLVGIPGPRLFFHHLRSSCSSMDIRVWWSSLYTAFTLTPGHRVYNDTKGT